MCSFVVERFDFEKIRIGIWLALDVSVQFLVAADIH
jgi:hypothetical protein